MTEMWTYHITEEALTKQLDAAIASRFTLSFDDVQTFGEGIVEEIKWHLSWRGEILWDVVRRPYVLAICTTQNGERFFVGFDSVVGNLKSIAYCLPVCRRFADGEFFKS